MILLFEAAPALPAGWDFCMTSKADTSGTAGKADRKARLAEELRANLQRRKAQARSRRTGGADERPDGLAAGGAAGAAGNDNEPAEKRRDLTERRFVDSAAAAAESFP